MCSTSGRTVSLLLYKTIFSFLCFQVYSCSTPKSLYLRIDSVPIKLNHGRDMSKQHFLFISLKVYLIKQHQPGNTEKTPKTCSISFYLQNKDSWNKLIGMI